MSKIKFENMNDVCVLIADTVSRIKECGLEVDSIRIGTNIWRLLYEETSSYITSYIGYSVVTEPHLLGFKLILDEKIDPDEIFIGIKCGNV